MVQVTNSKVCKVLKKLSDAQLRQAETRLHGNRRAFRDRIDDCYSRLWKLKDDEEHCNYLRLLVRTILGSRKGAHCLALCRDKDGRYTCKAKVGKYYGNSWYYNQKDHIYQEQCAFCRFTNKTKRNKMVYGQIFKSP